MAHKKSRTRQKSGPAKKTLKKFKPHIKVSVNPLKKITKYNVLLSKLVNKFNKVEEKGFINYESKTYQNYRKARTRKLLRQIAEIKVAREQQRKKTKPAALKGGILASDINEINRVCDSRRSRRETLFAKKLTGKGSGAKKRKIKPESNIKC